MLRCEICGSLDVKWYPTVPDWYDEDLLVADDDCFICPNCGRIDNVRVVFEKDKTEDV